MTTSPDRPGNDANLAAFPGDAHLAACALHLLLAQHSELVEIDFEWWIGSDGVIRPQLDVDHPDAIRATELLAKALELPVETATYTSGTDGARRMCVEVKGRWGGAEWRSTQYAAAPAKGTQIAGTPALRAVTS